MLKVENVETVGWEAAIRGMRNPMSSWSQGDSDWGMMSIDGYMNIPQPNQFFYHIGPTDKDLMMRLRKAGTDHRKFMRMLGIYMDITAPQFWWFEFDTYKVSTVRNSCSKMHKIHVKEFIPDDFSHEGIDEVGGEVVECFSNTLKTCEWLRQKFNETQEKKYWRALIELLPEGYNMRATIYITYETAANIHHGRYAHKVQEWHTFCNTLEALPYSALIVGDDPLAK